MRLGTRKKRLTKGGRKAPSLLEGERIVGEYWESATKEIRERLEDPLLKVEVDVEYDKNPATGLYERKHCYKVLKWFREAETVQLVIDGSPMTLVYDTGWWACQMSFDAWDGRVEKRMIAGRLRGRLAEIRAKEKARIEQHKKQKSDEAGAIGRDLGHDLYHKWHPKIYSTA